jgi:hypothetical protein
MFSQGVLAKRGKVKRSGDHISMNAELFHLDMQVGLARNSLAGALNISCRIKAIQDRNMGRMFGSNCHDPRNAQRVQVEPTLSLDHVLQHLGTQRYHQWKRQ